MRRGDLAADGAWAFRTEGWEFLPPMPREIAAPLGRVLLGWPSQPDGATLHQYDTRAVLKIEPLRLLACSAVVMLRVAAWLGAPGRVLDVAAWRSDPGGEPEGAQGWHRDVDDWRAVKLFVYLTDVDEGHGPHEYIPGSARPEWWRARGMMPDQAFIGSGRVTAVQRVLDQLPRIRVLGPAGTCWIENTYGFHRGTVPRDGLRVVAQVLYGLGEYEHGAARRVVIEEMWG